MREIKGLAQVGEGQDDDDEVACATVTPGSNI